MKKFFTFLVIFCVIFLFRTKIINIVDNIVDYAQINILNINLDKKENNLKDNVQNNLGNNSIKNENSVNNIDNNLSYKKTISYDNYKNLKLGENLESVKSKLGQPNNIEKSEYGFDWYVYNQDYSKFCMVGILNNKVVALFSNKINSNESNNIKLGDKKSQILKNYKALEYRLKGNVKYIISEDYYSLIKGNSGYITVFYDSFDENKISGIQIISKQVEDNLMEIYSKDTSITSNFENLNRYLINSEREANDLKTLSYNEAATLCARSHSKDMKENNYFDHNNLNNQTPFDRMNSSGIKYTKAAENIAAGQTSPIFAHYALINSKGHRVNILGDYSYVGVGVVFGGKLNMYLTQNFYNI